LLDTLESNGFIHYELSNFGKQNYFSKITPLIGWEKIYGYWTFGARYNGISRSWNVSNNIIYLKSIQEENYQMKEVLSGSLQ
jgi:oxygen-independent coproporphyrinogen-3 oxidase